MIYKVELTKAAEKDLRKVPKHVVSKLKGWIEQVEKDGLEIARQVPGFHDEPLKGKRAGQRSVRLSGSYRAIYQIIKSHVEFVRVEEVNKHEY